MYSEPLAYFITFRCYGTWLHGDARGSVDRRMRRNWGDPMIPRTPALECSEESRLNPASFRLTEPARRVVEAVVGEVCRRRSWTLHAVNPRSNHVHVVVTAPRCAPERVLNSLKSWCTRGFFDHGLIERGRKVWARHGSTIYLWTSESLSAKIQYVQSGQ